MPWIWLIAMALMTGIYGCGEDGGEEEAACRLGAAVCKNNQLQICRRNNGSLEWVVNHECKACTVEKGAIKCVGEDEKCDYTGFKCNADGTALLTCIDGVESAWRCDCVNDRCEKCADGAKRCNGKIPQKCKNGAWTDDPECQKACVDGECVKPPKCAPGVTEACASACSSDYSEGYSWNEEKGGVDTTYCPENNCNALRDSIKCFTDIPCCGGPCSPEYPLFGCTPACSADRTRGYFWSGDYLATSSFITLKCAEGTCRVDQRRVKCENPKIETICSSTPEWKCTDAGDKTTDMAQCDGNTVRYYHGHWTPQHCQHCMTNEAGTAYCCDDGTEYWRDRCMANQPCTAESTGACIASCADDTVGYFWSKGRLLSQKCSDPQKCSASEADMISCK